MQKVAAIQMTSGSDVDKNLQNASLLITQAVATGAKLIVLPENFALMGKTAENKLIIREASGLGKIQTFLAEQAQKNKIWLVGGTIPLLVENSAKAYNTCLVFNPQGKQIARYDKIHLFDATVTTGTETYHESASVQAGKEVVVFDSPLGKVGLAVCYDLRFPELFRALVAKGAEIFAIPTAFTVSTGQAHWEVLTRARAIENFSYVIGSCQTGTHDNGRQTYGHSLIIDPWGTIQTSLPTGTGIISAEINLERLKQIRTDFPALQHQRLGK